jgi:hypothetical protein
MVFRHRGDALPANAGAQCTVRDGLLAAVGTKCVALL